MPFVTIIKPEEPAVDSVTLELVVQDSDWFGFFDVMEVWRSRDTPQGPYEELTATKYKRARIPADAEDEPSPPVVGPLVNINGDELELLVDEKDEFTITITGVDPLTYTAIATQVIAQGLTRLNSYVTSEGKLVVETTETGTAAILRVVGGDVAAKTALPTTEPASLSFGRDPRIPLKLGQEVYLFTDQRGSSSYFYKTRYRNTAAASTSDFSAVFSVTNAIEINQDALAFGQMDLIQSDGRPLSSQEVRLHFQFSGAIVDGKTVAGNDIIKSTDDNGHVEFSLIRGQTVTVAIPGTDIARDIIVPTDESIKVFQLLDPNVGTGDDIFKVQIPDIVIAERRTL
jgi:hypothetical protein